MLLINNNKSKNNSNLLMLRKKNMSFLHVHRGTEEGSAL